MPEPAITGERPVLTLPTRSGRTHLASRANSRGTAGVNGLVVCSRLVSRPSNSSSIASVNPVPTLPMNCSPSGHGTPSNSAPTVPARRPCLGVQPPTMTSMFFRSGVLIQLRDRLPGS